MIKIETKIVGCDEENQYVQIKKYKAKNTSKAEHLCCIDTLVRAVLDNEKDMDINKMCRLIKKNYNTFLEEFGGK